MNGVYNFYRDGKLVGSSANLITDAGKIAIMRYLSGYTGHFGMSIRLGAGVQAATSADTSLQYESVMVPVHLITPNYSDTSIIFKGGIEGADAVKIYEAGLSSAIPDLNSDAISKPITTFESDTENWSGGAWNSTNTRIGLDSLRLSPATSATAQASLSDIYLDMTPYSNYDEFKFAYFASSNIASVKYYLHTTDTDYFSATFNSPAAGFGSSKITKAGMTKVGNPNWSQISKITVLATATSGGAGTVDFDGIRIEDRDTFSNSDILVSRSILPSPITKSAGVPMDVEYVLDLTL